MPAFSPGRLRHVAWVVGIAGALGALLPQRTDREADRASALAHALQRRGILAAPEDVQWIDRPGAPLGGVRAGRRAGAALEG